MSDRFIQQAIAQVLTPQFEAVFSPHSYGLRPGRSAHQAIQQAQEYIQEGKEYVVDIDLEKYFDRVNQDMLMARVARGVKDKRVLKEIRTYLEAEKRNLRPYRQRHERTLYGEDEIPDKAPLLRDSGWRTIGWLPRRVSIRNWTNG